MDSRTVDSDNADEWFLLDRRGHRYGPYPRSLLRSLDERGEIADDIFVWTEGVADWRPWSELATRVRGRRGGPRADADRASDRVPAARAAAVARPAVAKLPDDGPRPDKATGELTSVALAELAAPRRAAAKAVDLSLATLALLWLAGFFGADPDFGGWTRLLVALAWGFLEARLLATTGRTPGRLLFGLEVVARGGGRLSPVRAALRSLLVGLLGLGAGVPFLAVLTGVAGYQQLRRNGSTVWDTATGSEVVYAPWTGGRRVAAWLLAAVVITVVLVRVGWR
jgi:uncharacterized RDD family membrane protein YckC